MDGVGNKTDLVLELAWKDWLIVLPATNKFGALSTSSARRGM
jgi:hypothetical protein